MQSSSVLEAGAATVQPILQPNKILSDEVLTAFHPLVRLPLPRWSQQVLDLLQQSMGINPDYGLISVCFNQAALLEFNFGRTERAFKLCYAHLEWLAELISRTGRLELAVQAFDPWLNLGRLERLTGKYALSLERFEILSQFSAQNETILGPLTLTTDHWQAIVNDRPDIEAFVRKACLTDILKTLLKSKQYRATLELIEEIEEYNSAQNVYNQNSYRLLLEAKFISLCRLERIEEALELIALYNLNTNLKSGTSNSLLNFSFGLHQIEILAISNDSQAAQNQAYNLAQQAQLFNYDKEPRLFKIALSLRLAKLLEALGLVELALSVARQGYAANLAMQDELFEAEFLRLLVLLEPDRVEKIGRQQQLEQLGQTTCYSELKKRLLPEIGLLAVSDTAAECSTILDKLYESLFDLVW